MARFDVYAAERPDDGCLLDIQADILSDLATRIVVPLLPAKRAPKPARGLNPIFDVDGVSLVMVTQFLAAVPRAELRRPLLSLAARSDEIVGALDILLTGF
jgi:toxin CcdB